MNIMYKIRLTLIALGATLVLVQLPAPAVSALFESAKTDACKGVKLSDDPAINQNCDADAANSLTDTLHNIINVLSMIIGIAAVLVIVIAGFRYVTSAGDSGRVTSAKNALVYAVVGLVVAALAQVIVRFVLTKAT
jgi:hypothetical protein